MFKTKTAKAALIATLSAANLACVLLAQYAAIPCAICGLWIIAFASSMDIHLFTAPPATLNIERADTVTQNIPAPAEPPPAQPAP